jgi:CRISPR system Cascade subunit CasE
MYFSVITPSPGREREAAQQRAAGPYSEHQWLWRFFPAEENSPRDFLFRRLDMNGLAAFLRCLETFSADS